MASSTTIPIEIDRADSEMMFERVAGGIEIDERGDERHRDRDHDDEGGAPASEEEEEHHEGNEEESIKHGPTSDEIVLRMLSEVSTITPEPYVGRGGFSPDGDHLLYLVGRSGRSWHRLLLDHDDGALPSVDE